MKEEAIRGEDCQNIKRNNLKSVFNLLLTCPMSSSQLANSLGLSGSGMKKLTDFLKASEIVGELPSDKNSRFATFGRPPVRLCLNAKFGYVLILNFYTNTLILCDFSGFVAVKRSLQIKRHSKFDLSELNARINAAFLHYESLYPDFNRKLLSIVIVPDETLLCKMVGDSKEEFENYKTVLSATFACPAITVENYANCIALNEIFFGTLKNTRNAAVICLDDPTTASFVFGGRLYRGSDNQAGVLQKYVFVKEPDKEFESINVNEWMIRECTQRVKDAPDSYLYDFFKRYGDISFEQVIDAYRRNDPSARYVVHRVVTLAQKIICGTVTMLDLECVAVTGELLNISKEIGLIIAEEVNRDLNNRYRIELIGSVPSVNNGAIISGIESVVDLFLQNI